MLLVAIVTGAKADGATFTMSSIFDGTNTTATVTTPVNATLSTNLSKSNANQGKMGSDGNYIEVVLTDKKFSGASLNGYINTTNTEKNWAFQFSTNGGTTWTDEVTQANDGDKTAHEIGVAYFVK